MGGECVWLEVVVSVAVAVVLLSRSRLKYMPYPLDLKMVFEQTLRAIGPDRVIFGTDSSHFPRGFRNDILSAQLEILEALQISKRVCEKLFKLERADEA